LSEVDQSGRVFTDCSLEQVFSHPTRVHTRGSPVNRRYRASVSETSASLLIYDGDCSFCTTSADWVAARWQGRARAVPWQVLGTDELAAHGLTRDDVRSAAWWIDQKGHRSRGHVAIAHALAAGSGWPATVGDVLLVPPFRWIAAALYPLIAHCSGRRVVSAASCVPSRS
jgi:predicted DCC family thiol-disulfide oxidoreductase YuxK